MWSKNNWGPPPIMIPLNNWLRSLVNHIQNQNQYFADTNQSSEFAFLQGNSGQIWRRHFFRLRFNFYLRGWLPNLAGSVGPNSHFKAKKIRAGRAGPGHTGLGHTGPGQIWPGFFRAKNLMAQPGPNFGRTGLTHRAGPILPPLFPRGR